MDRFSVSLVYSDGVEVGYATGNVLQDTIKKALECCPTYTLEQLRIDVEEIDNEY